MNKAIWRTMTSAVALGTAVLSGSASAQQATVTGDAVNPGEIVVTAQRRSEALEKTPVAITVVSGATLGKQAITTERDLQFAAPGLTVRSGQNDNQLNYSLRGQTVDSYSSSLPSVLPYINEVQVGGSGSTAFYDLQSVQVLKGPQGTLFGRNSTGGAVLFTTTKPSKEVGGYVTARYGRFNDVQLEGALNVPLATDKLLLRVAGSYRKRDGIQLNLFDGKRIGVVDRSGVRASLTLFPDGPFKNELVVDYFRAGGSSLSPVVANVIPLANYAPGVPIVPSAILFPGFEAFAALQKRRGPYVVDIDGVTVSRTRKWFVSNVSTLKLSDALTLKNVFGFVRSKYFESGDIDATPFRIDSRGDAITGPRGGDGLIKQYSNELQLLGKVFDNRLEFVLGGYFSNNSEHLVNTSYIIPDFGFPTLINAGTTTSKAIAAYAQGTLDTGLAGFKLTAGVRYTSERVKFVRDSIDNTSIANPAFAPFYANGRFVSPQQDTFKKPSWTLGLQNQVTNSLLLYVNTRRSFRSGGFNFQAPPTPGFGTVSGGEYLPEIATDVEFGAKYRGRVGGLPTRLNVALYNMWVSNVQRSNYVSIYGNLAGITVNVPKANVKGFELDGTIEPAKWLRLGGSLNYTDARFTSNRVPVLGTGGATTFATYDTYPDTPKWSGTFYADATVPVNERFDVTLRGDVYAQTSNYYSSTGKSLNLNSQIAGYALANFRAGVEEHNGHLSFGVLVKNAFNKEYYTGGIGFANLFGMNLVVPGEPRTFLLEARYRY